MCTMESPNPRRSVHRSIIKEIKQIESWESGCIADEEHIQQISSTVSPLNEDASTKTVIFSSLDNNEISSKNMHQRSVSFSSQSPSILQNYRHFDRETFRFPYDETNEEVHLPIASRRSRSYNNLSRSPLHETTTGDSGTGDSLIASPIETSAKPLHYEVVPIYGQDNIIALMANRYEFDSTKVAQYKMPKRTIFGKSTHSMIETTPKSHRQNSTDSKKSASFFSRLKKTLKPSSPNQMTFSPMIRHHSSQNTITENH